MTVIASKSEVVLVTDKDDVPDKDLRKVIELLIDKQDCCLVKITDTQSDLSEYVYYELKKNYRQEDMWK